MKESTETQTVHGRLNQLTRALDSGAAEQIRSLLGNLHPAEIADVLESFPHGPREILWELVDPEDHGETLLHVNDEVRNGLIEEMNASDLLAATDASRWLTWVAAFTIIAASIVALTKDNLKARLAYSTVSQLAYIVLGGALATSAGVLGGGMHIAMHAFGKITLFMCAGAIFVATGTGVAPSRARVLGAESVICGSLRRSISATGALNSMGISFGSKVYIL